MLKNQKGITLVALVITIIVLLILATVAITMALNTGLFAKTQEAADKSKAAEANEARDLNTVQTVMENYINNITP